MSHGIDEAPEGELRRRRTRTSKRKHKKHTLKSKKLDNLVYNMKWVVMGLAVGIPVLALLFYVME